MNNELTNNTISPRLAVIVYSSRGDYGADYYLETREIKKIGSNYELMAPVPMADSTMRNIANVFFKKDNGKISHDGLVGEHILYTFSRPGTTIVMWWRPAMLRNLNFASSVVKVKGKSVAMVPATLYLLINKSLYIFALKEDERPGMKTKLFNAPFLNIYADGNVCIGTARVGTNTGTFEGEAERYERAFYMAEQNGGERKQCKTDLAKLWPTLIASKKPFPSSEFIVHSKYKTLGDLMNKLISTKHEG